MKKKRNYWRSFTSKFNEPDLKEFLTLIPYKTRKFYNVKVLCSHNTGLYGIYYFNHEKQKWELDYELNSKYYAIYDRNRYKHNYIVKQLK